MKYLKVLIIFVFISLNLSCKKQAGSIPDTIITNAKIWSNGKIQDFDAIAIKGDKIMITGKTEELIKLKTAQTKIIDAQQKLLCPGFIDAHVHFLDGGFNLSSVQLRDASSRDTFIQRIRAYALTIPKGNWITGGDWNHELWGGQLPERSWIDSITPDHPVAINRLDGHMILCNSLAMKLAGITNATKDVAGGEIPRNKNKEIIGIFKDNAATLIYSKMPDPGAEATDHALKSAMQYVVAHGVTGVHHMGTFQDLEAFRRNKSSLITRIYAATPLARWQELKTYCNENGKGDSILHWGILKGFMDGSLGSHTAAMSADFSDKPGDKGFLVNPLDSMKKWILAADKAGMQIAVHAIGDRAIASLIDIFDTTILINGTRDRRFRIEHFQHPAAKEIARMKMDDIIASMQPYHAIDDGCWAEKVIGPERIKTTYAFKSILAANTHLAFGSDWFVAPPIPLLGVYAANTRQTLDGKNPGGWVPAQKISISEALSAYTEGGAYGAFQENILGSIKTGYLADLVLLDQDLFSIQAEEIKNVNVKWTMLGGKLVFEK
ncbi:MAG: amidohydrolase family protein [Saprospiraceae bacterium]